MRIIALVGLSGVGKSTLLKRMASHIEFEHLQASVLIKSELKRTQSELQSSEGLRQGQVIDNQAALISGFLRTTEGMSGLVVLDGHTLIDAGEKLIEIPADVFRQIGVEHMIFLQEAPERIAERRGGDIGRKRPNRTVETLAYHQVQAIIVAARITLELDIPLSVISGSQHDVLLAYFT